MRRELLAPGPRGLVVQALAAVLMLWARLTFGWRSFHGGANPTEGGLVTTGPYRWLRHPIYASFLLFLTASLISHWSAVNAALVGVAGVGGPPAGAGGGGAPGRRAAP